MHELHDTVVTWQEYVEVHHTYEVSKHPQTSCITVSLSMGEQSASTKSSTSALSWLTRSPTSSSSLILPAQLQSPLVLIALPSFFRLLHVTLTSPVQGASSSLSLSDNVSSLSVLCRENLCYFFLQNNRVLSSVLTYQSTHIPCVAWHKANVCTDSADA